LPKNTVEEAILGVVSAIDKPASPASTAKQHFHNGLFGRTPQVLNAFRDRVIQVSESDIKRVAEQYLHPQKASIGIISHTGENNAIDQLSQQTEAKILTL